MKALILVKFSSLETRDAYHQLKNLKRVSESYMVYGRYDAVVFIQAEDLEEIRRIILSDIHPIPGVIETLPCIIVEDDNMSLTNQELRPHIVRQNS
jgi:DNA-binding Lrp family transcriptional regulator